MIEHLHTRRHMPSVADRSLFIGASILTSDALSAAFARTEDHSDAYFVIMGKPSVEATLHALSTLDTSNLPFTFHVDGDTIVGYWKVTDSHWFAPLGVTDEFRDYRITVSFDEDRSTYSAHERTSSKKQHLGISGYSGSFEWNSGSIARKEFKVGFGREKDDAAGVGVHTVRFSTSQIKQPLFAFLAEQGWRRRRWLFKR